ncbi:hypothetical protein [Peribacillus simplex]|uniref:hypothetical protein n=1 Tax=Peribacillus simplex TaxID=1478 RepID=UPI0033369992
MNNQYFPNEEGKLEYILQIYSMDMKVKALWVQNAYEEYSNLMSSGEFNVLLAFRKATEIINHSMAIVRMVEEAGFVKDPRERAKMRERIMLINNRWEVPKPPKKLRAIRNSLEHFEQKMDEWVTSSRELHVIDFNIGELSTGTGSIANVNYFRNIDGYNFYFRRKPVNLTEIYNWSKEVSMCLQK